MTRPGSPGRPEDEALRAAVESIGGHARTTNLARAERLRLALSDLGSGCWEESRRREATEIAHQLVGSAGTFGFAGASQLAGEVERYLVLGDFSDPARLATVRGWVGQLVEELVAEPDYQLDEDERDPTS